MPKINLTQFHKSYYRILQAFADGLIKHLIVSVPPQHGKSLGSSELLPAYLLGRNPDLKIALASYNATQASRFNKRTQRIIQDGRYRYLFPNTELKQSAKTRKGANGSVQTSTEFDILNKEGSLISVGREGSLTGNPVDVFILDDLYKDTTEAYSPTIREKCSVWYNDVVKSRQHNDTQELIVFTRWHEEDLIAELLQKQKYTVLENWEQINNLSPSEWLVVNFEAIKTGAPTEIDPRNDGEPLWPARHNLDNLVEKRKLDPNRFECLYQGKPYNAAGMLYGKNFKTWSGSKQDLPTFGIGNRTDLADSGTDKTLSITYHVGQEINAAGITMRNIYVTDVFYTDDNLTEIECHLPAFLIDSGARYCNIERNNGGRYFADQVARRAPGVSIRTFHQNKNKEGRIMSAAPTVLHCIHMPERWEEMWPAFYRDATHFNRQFRANAHDEVADVLSGIVEDEIVESSWGVRVRN